MPMKIYPRNLCLCLFLTWLLRMPNASCSDHVMSKSKNSVISFDRIEDVRDIILPIIENNSTARNDSNNVDLYETSLTVENSTSIHTPKSQNLRQLEPLTITQETNIKVSEHLCRMNEILKGYLWLWELIKGPGLSEDQIFYIYQKISYLKEVFNNYNEKYLKFMRNWPAFINVNYEMNMLAFEKSWRLKNYIRGGILKNLIITIENETKRLLPLVKDSVIRVDFLIENIIRVQTYIYRSVYVNDLGIEINRIQDGWLMRIIVIELCLSLGDVTNVSIILSNMREDERFKGLFFIRLLRSYLNTKYIDIPPESTLFRLKEQVDPIDYTLAEKGPRKIKRMCSSNLNVPKKKVKNK